MSRSILLLALALASHAEESPQEIASLSSQMANGATVHFTSRIEPPLKDSQFLLLYSGVSGGRNRIHRTLKDKSTNTIFGYDLVAETIGNPDLFLVHIEPLTNAMIDQRLDPGNQGKLGALPKYPPMQTVRDGDTIVLDILVSPDGRQKLVDYITITKGGLPSMTPAALLVPRDLTLDDGPLALRFDLPVRVHVNGRQTQDRLAFTVKTGATLWFSIGGRGRYVLSLAPREGFQKLGAIRDRILSFQAGADSYEIHTGSPILGAGKAWNLYGKFDPSYTNARAAAESVAGGIDRLENLLIAEGAARNLQDLLRRRAETAK